MDIYYQRPYPSPPADFLERLSDVLFAPIRLIGNRAFILGSKVCHVTSSWGKALLAIVSLVLFPLILLGAVFALLSKSRKEEVFFSSQKDCTEAIRLHHQFFVLKDNRALATQTWWLNRGIDRFIDQQQERKRGRDKESPKNGVAFWIKRFQEESQLLRYTPLLLRQRIPSFLARGDLCQISPEVQKTLRKELYSIGKIHKVKDPKIEPFSTLTKKSIPLRIEEIQQIDNQAKRIQEICFLQKEIVNLSQQRAKRCFYTFEPYVATKKQALACIEQDFQEECAMYGDALTPERKEARADQIAEYFGLTDQERNTLISVEEILEAKHEG